MSDEDVELKLRDGSSRIVDVVSAVTGEEFNTKESLEVFNQLEHPKILRPKLPAGTKTDRRRAYWIRKAEAKKTKKAKQERDKQALRDLKVKVEAGSTSHPDYLKKLAAAKRLCKVSVDLPYIAKQKWADPKFQQEMADKGFKYDPSLWKGWLPYEAAKAMQREWIGARSRSEYEFFVKLFGLRFMPARPDNVYEEWSGWADFLNTTNTFSMPYATKDNMLPFHEALSFVRTLKLRNITEWRAACRDGRVPLTIPSQPSRAYPDQWVDLNHWLGVDSAADVVKGVITKEYVWILYSDGRPNAFWWAKLSEEQFSIFKNKPEITVLRAYVFEGELANDAWEVIERYSTVFEKDSREREVEGPELILQVRNTLDTMLEWKM